MDPKSRKRPEGGGEDRSKEERERELAELATRQHGVLGRRQLLARGFSEATMKRWLRSGRLHRLHREAFAFGHSRVYRRGHLMAAVLACSDGAVLCHRCAAELWELVRRQRGPIDVNAPAGRQYRPGRLRIRLHRCKLRPEEATSHDGIPVTTVARTLFDFAEVAPYDEIKRAAEAADRRNLLRLRELESVCERGRGRRALRPVRQLLVELGAPAEGRSPLEIRFAEFIRAHGIPTPAQNVLVLGHEVDALWPKAKLVVELDSWEHHGHRAAFERDRARDPKLLLAGYRTIRITHRRLDDEPDQLAEEIRQLLSA